MTLHLTLKKRWFDMILRGEKKEEYREIKKYWAIRLCGTSQYNGNDKGLLPDDKSTYWNGFYPINFRPYSEVVFKNGYGKNSPSCTVELKSIEIGMTKSEWCDEGEIKAFVLKLGNVIFFKNCNP